MDQKDRMLEKQLEKVGKIHFKAKMKALAEANMQNISLNDLKYISAISALNFPSLSDLAHYLEISNAAATNFVNKLVKGGLVMKEQNQQDKRFFYLSLTNKGKLVKKALNQANDEFITLFKNRLNEEEYTYLIHLLEKAL